MVTTTRLKVTDMGCPDCVDKVEGGLRQVDGVSDVSASLMSQTVTVTHESVPRARLTEANEFECSCLLVIVYSWFRVRTTTIYTIGNEW